MLHMPVAKWGRDFLERGLIEARFVKPVYDGEIAEVSAVEDADGLTIEVQSKGDLCATGTASLPAAAPKYALNDFAAANVVNERKPVNATSYELGKWLGCIPRDWTGDAAKDYLADIRETDPIYAREALGHPGLLPRIMNKVLVDNAILGPWIHVGSKMQLLSAGKVGDELTARAKVVGNYEKKGHRFVELDALVVANGTTPLAHMLAHRDLPAARAGGGVRAQLAAPTLVMPGLDPGIHVFRRRAESGRRGCAGSRARRMTK